MRNHFTRRRFLATAGATAGAGLVGKSLFNVDKVFAQRPAPFVRPNVAGLTLASPAITSYIAGITAMKALPAANPVSWTYQAAIHGTVAVPLLAQNTCQHGTNFFWSWHRMYLYWFERIVRKQSGDASWALPYWDWQTQLNLPPMFQNPPVGSPVLNVAARTASMNNGTGSLSNLTPGVNAALAQCLYEGTPGADSLIQLPHNSVHVEVGGIMGSINSAAQDPIFFLHHANCDRLWDIWLAQGMRCDPVTDPVWENQVFTFFDENGAQQMMTSCDVVRAAAQLNYTYQGEPPQVNQFCGVAPVCCTGTSTVVINQCIPKPPCFLPPGPGPFYFEFTVTSQLAQQLIAYAENSAYTLYLEFGGVTASTQPGVVWDVYVGLPLGSTPYPTSPYYVGTYGLYGPGVADQPPDGNEPASFSVPVNTAILTALQAGELTIPVQFAPHGVVVSGKLTLPQQASTVSIAEAQLSVQTITQGEKIVAKIAARQ
ncbi:MAG: tyrosinase family protein [Candidatus Sulfotelmatobacter sp.]